jgi:hypothetical protein
VVPIPDRLRLALEFDVEAIASEMEALPEHVWIPHFNKAIHSGDWSGAALRSIGGDLTRIYPDPSGSLEFADTSTLALCPSVGRALPMFQCPLTTVRLLALGPGAEIREHHDDRLGYEDGDVRLHIPIVTAPGVDFSLGGLPVVMALGECWYLDLRLTHRAANRSSVRRVHLVIDCKVNPWLEGLFNDSLQRQFTSPY